MELTQPQNHIDRSHHNETSDPLPSSARQIASQRVAVYKPASPVADRLSFFDRLNELERENARLQGLVAELLVKNQQLRSRL